MTKEEKQLLLKDLCARLPYGVVVETQLVNAPRAKYPVLKVLQSYMLCDFMQTIENVIHKPYLRSMSSMTEEEINEFILISDTVLWLGDKRTTCILSIEQMNWLNAHHFDFLGLISKGLAIEVTEKNNPYK